MAVAVALALTALTHLLRPVCTGSAGGEGSEGAKKEREPGEGSIVSSGALVQRLCPAPRPPCRGRRLLTARVVPQISNTKKIKKMSKKQLKSISKMDTTGVKPKVFTKKEKKAAGMDTTQ